MSEHKYLLEITGSPLLAPELRKMETDLSASFKIKSETPIEDPARLGFSLKKAVAIVAIVSGLLTSVDLTDRLVDTIEHSGSQTTVMQAPSGGKIIIELPKDKRISAAQRSDLLDFFDRMMR
jgi:hypothetical protein